MRKRATAGASNGRNAIVLQVAKLAGVLVAGVVIAVGFALSESSIGQVSAIVSGLAISSLAYYAVVKIYWRD
jgi:hypothetical protein